MILESMCTECDRTRVAGFMCDGCGVTVRTESRPDGWSLARVDSVAVHHKLDELQRCEFVASVRRDIHVGSELHHCPVCIEAMNKLRVRRAKEHHGETDG